MKRFAQKLQRTGVLSQAPFLLLAARSRLLPRGLMMVADNCPFLLGRLRRSAGGRGRAGPVLPHRSARLRSAASAGSAAMRAAEPEPGRWRGGAFRPPKSRLGWAEGGRVAPVRSSRGDPGMGTAALGLCSYGGSHLGLPDVLWLRLCFVFALCSPSYEVNIRNKKGLLSVSSAAGTSLPGLPRCLPPSPLPRGAAAPLAHRRRPLCRAARGSRFPEDSFELK